MITKIQWELLFSPFSLFHEEEGTALSPWVRLRPKELPRLRRRRRK